jgi:hypothetical protein
VVAGLMEHVDSPREGGRIAAAIVRAVASGDFKAVAGEPPQAGSLKEAELRFFVGAVRDKDSCGRMAEVLTPHIPDGAKGKFTGALTLLSGLVVEPEEHFVRNALASYLMGYDFRFQDREGKRMGDFINEALVYGREYLVDPMKIAEIAVEDVLAERRKGFKTPYPSIALPAFHAEAIRASVASGRPPLDEYNAAVARDLAELTRRADESEKQREEERRSPLYHVGRRVRLLYGVLAEENLMTHDQFKLMASQNDSQGDAGAGAAVLESRLFGEAAKRFKGGEREFSAALDAFIETQLAATDRGIRSDYQTCRDELVEAFRQRAKGAKAV